MTVQEGRWRRCARTERIYAYVLQTLPSDETANTESHTAECAECLHEFETLQPLVASFVSWPTNAMQKPSELLVAHRAPNSRQ